MKFPETGVGFSLIFIHLILHDGAKCQPKAEKGEKDDVFFRKKRIIGKINRKPETVSCQLKTSRCDRAGGGRTWNSTKEPASR